MTTDGLPHQAIAVALPGSLMTTDGLPHQAIALALPGSLVALSSLEGTPHYLYYVLLPWLYPLYYVALFLPRQMDDDAQLCAKYGEVAFAEYTRRVPYRVVPGVW